MRQSIQGAAQTRGSVELLLADNQTDPALALTNAQQLLDAKIDLVIEYQQDEHTNHTGGNMQRIAFLLKVKHDRIEEYKRRHQDVWPDMLAALRETGWHNYSLYMRDDGLLFGYLETPDFDTARASMAAREVNARWQAEMGEFFEQLDGLRPDQGMAPLEEVFHLD